MGSATLSPPASPVSARARFSPSRVFAAAAHFFSNSHGHAAAGVASLAEYGPTSASYRRSPVGCCCFQGKPDSTTLYDALFRVSTALAVPGLSDATRAVAVDLLKQKNVLGFFIDSMDLNNFSLSDLTPEQQQAAVCKFLREQTPLTTQLAGIQSDTTITVVLIPLNKPRSEGKSNIPIHQALSTMNRLRAYLPQAIQGLWQDTIDSRLLIAPPVPRPGSFSTP